MLTVVGVKGLVETRRRYQLGSCFSESVLVSVHLGKEILRVILEKMKDLGTLYDFRK